MATLTVDRPVVEEAKTRVLDAVEEAKRAIVRGTRQFEDLRNEATYRVRKAPLASVGIGFGAGIVLGAMFGLIAGKVAKNKTSNCC